MKAKQSADFYLRKTVLRWLLAVALNADHYKSMQLVQFSAFGVVTRDPVSGAAVLRSKVSECKKQDQVGTSLSFAWGLRCQNQNVG
jgi:hypothetical protein